MRQSAAGPRHHHTLTGPGGHPQPVMVSVGAPAEPRSAAAPGPPTQHPLPSPSCPRLVPPKALRGSEPPVSPATAGGLGRTAGTTPTLRRGLESSISGAFALPSAPPSSVLGRVRPLVPWALPESPREDEGIPRLRYYSRESIFLLCCIFPHCWCFDRLVLLSSLGSSHPPPVRGDKARCQSEQGGWRWVLSQSLWSKTLFFPPSHLRHRHGHTEEPQEPPQPHAHGAAPAPLARGTRTSPGTQPGSSTSAPHPRRGQYPPPCPAPSSKTPLRARAPSSLSPMDRTGSAGDR